MSLRTKGFKLCLLSISRVPAQEVLGLLVAARKERRCCTACGSIYVSLDKPKESANNAEVNCICDDIITPRPNRLSSNRDQAWEASNNLHDNLSCCDSCFGDREATLFCSMLRQYLVKKNSSVYVAPVHVI
ncbi:Uncharacterized protein TCM_040784 [Theobroma cacao]|uniref:Uncharacterized protein n=1 Tax=Theobroma cacao TaxID=3641 RepID=A0A061GZB7_THECC|nr:Uncharacterized protein TCM_040784 [Theobroma cacao]